MHCGKQIVMKTKAASIQSRNTSARTTTGRLGTRRKIGSLVIHRAHRCASAVAACSALGVFKANPRRRAACSHKGSVTGSRVTSWALKKARNRASNRES